MTDVYVIRNQRGHYWGKAREWVSGGEPRTVMRVKHRDEALNTLFELSSRDIELRGEVLAVELNERGDPLVEPGQIPLPRTGDDSEMAEPTAERAVETAEPPTRQTVSVT